MSVENRKAFLETVGGLVNGDRNREYDEPIVDFQCTAEILNAVFGHMLKETEAFEAWHVPVIQIAVKLSRLRKSPGKADHSLDIGGYATCLYDVLVESDIIR